LIRTEKMPGRLEVIGKRRNAKKRKGKQENQS
jgi:hypothetical protein